MSHQAYTLLGLTAIVGGLVGLVVFAFLRFSAAARDAKRRTRESGSETALLPVVPLFRFSALPI